MGRKKTILTVVVVVLLSAAAVRFVALGRRGGSSDIGKTYTYMCGACEAQFEMDDAAIRKHERARRVKTPPNEYKQYPCAECGEIAAYYHEVL